MIDPKYMFYGMTANNLPQIVKHSASNQIHISNLLQLIQNYEAKFLERAQIFTSGIFVGYCLPVTYICVLILVQGKKVADINPLFLFQSCYTFGVSFFIIIQLLQFGVAANNVDDLFKGEVMEVRMDMVKLRVNSHNNQIFLRKQLQEKRDRRNSKLKHQALILIQQ